MWRHRRLDGSKLPHDHRHSVLDDLVQYHTVGVARAGQCTHVLVLRELCGFCSYTAPHCAFNPVREHIPAKLTCEQSWATQLTAADSSLRQLLVATANVVSYAWVLWVPRKDILPPFPNDD